nr:YibE/F family protein [Chloroflexota bacterium]
MSLPSPRRRQLVAVVAGIAALLVIISLPDLAPPPSGGEPIEVVRARIVEFLPPQQPVDPSAPELGIQPDVLVEVLDGPRSGQRTGAYLQGPSGELDLPRYALGEEVVVTFTQQPEGGDFVAVSDRWRLPTLAFLTVAFGAAVALVAGGRGLRALLALALTVAIVLKIVVPLLLQGVEPIPLAVIVASFVTVLTIGLTEGITRPAVAAILGTFAALALTAVLSAVSTTLAGFTNAAGTDLVYLQGTTAGTPLDLRGMLLAAFI